MKTIVTVLLRIVLILAPITSMAMGALIPTAAEAASPCDEIVDEVYNLITQGKSAAAIMALKNFYYEGGNMSTALGLLQKRLAKESEAAKFLELLEVVKRGIPEKMLPVAPFVIIIDDEEVKRALSPAAGQRGENDEA